MLERPVSQSQGQVTELPVAGDTLQVELEHVLIEGVHVTKLNVANRTVWNNADSWCWESNWVKVGVKATVSKALHNFLIIKTLRVRVGIARDRDWSITRYPPPLVVVWMLSQHSLLCLDNFKCFPQSLPEHHLPASILIHNVLVEDPNVRVLRLSS